MHPAIISLLVLFLVCSTAHTLTLPLLAHFTSAASLTSSNLPTTFELATTRPQNITDHPSNFLGVHCYRLLPATVNLVTCQPLFARLLSHGNVYEEKDWWNGSCFRAGAEPCTVRISSPDRQHDRRVKVSMADIVTYATEVLQTCQETSTGGANTFQGTWRVVVTRDVVSGAAAASQSGLSDE